MNKPRIIYNPTAGKGKAGQVLDQVLTLLEERGFEFDLLLTEKIGDATEKTVQAVKDGCTLIVAAGGDGTINEVVNGLMRAPANGKPLPTLAVLPVGRGNDFAFGVDIPSELEEAVDTIINGQKRKIDVGYLEGGDYPGGRYFCNGIGLGFDAVVGFEANKISWLHGGAAYLAGLIRTIFKYAKAPVYELTMDDETRKQPFLMISIMNGRRMGGAFHMAPDGDPGDGKFNLCLANQVPQIKILPLATKFMSGTQKGHPAVSMVQASKIRIRAIEGSIPAHADGETICTAGETLFVEIKKEALEILSLVNGENNGN